MTDEEQKKMGLTNSQRTIYEYFENHPEDLAKFGEALRPVTEAIADVVVKFSEALKPIVDVIIPIIEAMPAEDLINDEEDSEDD